MDYYYYSKKELLIKSKIPIINAETNDQIFKIMAKEMVKIISENNKIDEPTVLICPVGPVGQYAYLVRMINQFQVNLKNVWFINMDEYLTEDRQWVDLQHPLSFRGFMNREVYSKILPNLLMPIEQRVFPNPNKLEQISKIIKKIGKVDACFGGIGINGHVAFNEPQSELSNEEFISLQTRILKIDPMTIAVNAAGDLQGAIELMPKWCVTIGMHEILKSKKIRLGVFREWHRSVLRRVACGEMSTQFPASLLQLHDDFCLLASDLVLNYPLERREGL